MMKEQVTSEEVVLVVIAALLSVGIGLALVIAYLQEIGAP